MKNTSLTRRDFLKLAGASTAVIVPAALGVSVYHTALGDVPLERSPYVEAVITNVLDGSVPILLIVNKDSDNPFGIYLTEILRAEGLNCFHTTDLSKIQPASLEKYEVAVLAQTQLDAAQAEMFETYVARGGRLVVMKPDDRMVSIFGMERSAGTLSKGYIKTEPDHPSAQGINPLTLQIHDTANLYSLTGARSIAWLYSDRDARSEYPAITINQFGDGLAVSFAFDLAKSIAYMRQGNPELSNQDMDGLNGERTVDMFVDWIDLERIQIPQADEQQRLFVNILTTLSRQPLPRLWYFPKDKKSLLVVTGDSHGSYAPVIDDVLRRVEKFGGHMTVYYSPSIVSDIGRAARWARFWLTDHVPVVSDILSDGFGSPTPFMVENWREHGHEFTLHPYVEEGLEKGWGAYWKEFTGRGYAPLSQTVRTHRVLWTGWTETARIQAVYGMRMNFDYYHVGPSLQKINGEWVNGYLTGSGRAMKFIDSQGRIIDIYQQLTQLTDEHLIQMNVPGWGVGPQLSALEAVGVAKYMLECSVNHDYCAIVGQFHTDPFQVGGDPAEKGGTFLEGTLDYANQLDVPILSAQEWLEFTDLRHDSDFVNVVWDSSALTLTLRLVQGGAFPLLPHNNPDSTLTVLIPTHHAERTLASVSVDGVTTSADTRLELSGTEFVLVIITAQEHSLKAVYA